MDLSFERTIYLIFVHIHIYAYVYVYIYNQINSNAASVPRPCRSWRISTTRPINLALVLWKFTTRLWPMSITWVHCQHWSTIAIRLRSFMKVESMLPYVWYPVPPNCPSVCVCAAGELQREEDVLEWLVQNKSTGDEDDVIEDVTSKTLATLISNIDNLVVLFCMYTSCVRQSITR